MTIREAEKRLDSREISEQMAYERAYGIGDAYFIVGQVCATIARAMSGAKLGPEEFVPFYKNAPAPGEQSPDEQRAIVRAKLAAHERA